MIKAYPLRYLLVMHKESHQYGEQRPLIAGLPDELRKAIEFGQGLDFLQDEAKQLTQFRDEVAQDLLYPEKS